MSRTGWLLTTTPLGTQPLIEVSITSPTNGQVLIYNTATSRWINGDTVNSGYTISSETVIQTATIPFVLTSANILTKQILLVYNGVSSVVVTTITLPAATAMISELSLTSDDLSFDFSVSLLSWTASGGTSGNFGGTGVTTRSSTIINTPGSALFRIRRTSATTVSVYALANKG